jgi:hypothetical protein
MVGSIGIAEQTENKINRVLTVPIACGFLPLQTTHCQ